MAKDTITFILYGEVPLESFSEAIERWAKLIDALSREVGQRTDIEWEIAKLQSSNPTVTIKGRSPDINAVEKVVVAQGIVWKALEHNDPIPYSDFIGSKARAITQILDGKITQIEIKTDEDSAVVEQAFDVDFKSAEDDYSFGTVTGYIETITKHNQLSFTVYDLVFNRAIVCKFSEEQKRKVLSGWERRVRISGKIYRNAFTNRPSEIRDITSIEILEDYAQGAFEAASGVIPWQEGYELPEKTIRRIRDGE